MASRQEFLGVLQRHHILRRVAKNAGEIDPPADEVERRTHEPVGPGK